MKKTILALCLILQTSAFASPIHLQEIRLAPGATITVEMAEKTVVSCAGNSEERPYCKIKQGYGFTIHMGNDSVSSSYSTLDEAVAAFQKLRDAGVCR